MENNSNALDLFSSLSNWGRWGENDQQGTLNLITPEHRRAAAGLVREGLTVSLASDVETRTAAGTDHSAQRFMLSTGEGLSDPQRLPTHEPDIAEDVVMYPVHGVANTHLDALGHYFWNGKMWNGKPAEHVTAALGATINDVRGAKAGIFTRGVLIDVPALRGIDWLEGGQGIGAEDLLEFERTLGIQIGEGDALLLRTGQPERLAAKGHPADGPTYSGWRIDALPLLSERGVSLIGCDGPAETGPSGVQELEHPVHQIGLIAMGLWLMDNLSLAEVATVASEVHRSEFCFTTAPIRFVGSTGSLVNPLAVF